MDADSKTATASSSHSLSDPLVPRSVSTSHRSGAPQLPQALAPSKSTNKLRFMPIRISNRFNRRKSSGNALEFGEPPASGEPSFRVLERPAAANRSSYDTDQITKPPPAGRPRTSPNNSARRPYSYFGGDGSDLSSNRGSGNTNNSNSTTLESTKRFSYASTIPSSVDSHDDEGDLPFQPRQKYAPIPRTNTEPVSAVDPDQQSKKSFSLKAAGRAFSFGAKSAKNIPSKENDIPPLPTRDRAMTASSYASTATPPKLDLGGTGGLGLGDSSFGDLFGKRKSTIMEEPSPSFLPGQTPLNTQTPTPMSHTQESLSMHMPDSQPQPHASAPSHVDHHFPPRQDSYPPDNYPPRDIPPRNTGSPYSWKSGASEERLMSSPYQPPYKDSPAFRGGPALHTDVDNSAILDALNASRFLDNEHNPQPPRHISETNPLPRNRGPSRQPPSSYRAPEPQRRSPLANTFPSTPQDRGDGFSDVDLTPQARNVSAGDDEPLFDAPRPRRPIFRANARAATAPPQNNKVMTPAEFEEYKQHKENAPPEEDDESDASSESEPYEEDDENERQKEAAKQRRKQEAHLAVYRQQMMKVTGEQPSELPSHQPTRAPLERSTNSAPSLLGAMPFENKTSPEPGKSDEEEDEEVPLGVLQAHGFPNKNRPPARNSQSTSSVPRPESTATYPQPAGAARNEPTAGGGGNPNLPVFAKNLPQDPYVGASLVNPPTRESLAFNNNHTPPPGPQQPPPPAAGNLPPGGLVGVIATEERAKALRRGSPNTRGTYDPAPPMQLPHEVQQQQMMQQMMQQQQQQMPQPQGHMANPTMQHMPQPNTQNQMSAGEQSQLQVANQMTQMMQMQMQWMQMMMTQQNGGNMPNGMQTPQLPQQNFGQPNFLNTDPMARPTSMASAASAGSHQRGASNISRGPSPQHLPANMNGMPTPSSQSVYGMQAPGNGYAPSIAPSERSVVGQPSRYRPVTPGGGQNRDSRTSSMSQQTVQGLPLRGQRSQSRLRNDSSRDTPKPTIKAVEKPKRASHDDDDDDEGWAEMQRQRQARQNRWKQSKPESTVPGGQEGGLEGLLYEGPHA